MLLLVQNLSRYFLSAFTCLLFLCVHVYAQTPLFKKLDLKYQYTSGNVNVVYTDPNGMLWIGTSYGILKTNGSNFFEFKMPSQTPKINVTAINTERKYKTWFGTTDGKIGLIENDKVSFCFFEEGCPKKPISGIVTDHEYRNWFCTKGEGIYYTSNKWLYNINSDDGLTDNYCYAAICDKENNLWVATDNGITVCKIVSGKKIIVKKFQSKDGLPDNIIKDIAFLNDSVLIAGTQDHGICFINTKTNLVSIPNKYRTWKHGEVNKISILNNQVWYATAQYGLVLDKGGESELIQYASFQGLKFDKTYSISIDLQNNLWIAYSDGVLRSTGCKLQLLDSVGELQVNNVHQLLVTKNAQLVFTPDQGLVLMPITKLNSLALKKYEVTPPESAVDIVSLCEDECGFIWIGTTGRGLYRMNSKTGKIAKVPLQGMDDATILSISIKNNFIWIAWLGGVNKFLLPEDCSKNEIVLQKAEFDPQKKAGDYYVYTVFNDNRGTTWIGTDGRGLLKVEKGSFKFFNSANQLNSDVIYTITEDTNHKIWFSTAGNGLKCIEGDSLFSFTETNGLSENIFTALCSDNNGNILAVSDNGFDLICNKTQSVINYGKEWGLTSNNVDLNAVDVFDNVFYIGTEKGIFIYDSKFEPVNLSPQTLVESIKSPERDITSDSIKELSYAENNVTFSISHNYLSNADNISFQYLLEGYSKQWNTTRDNRINFPSLPSGKYTFKVRASSNQSFSSSAISEVVFYIKKPFWKKLWFVFLCSALFFALLFLYLKWRDENSRKINALKNEKLLFQFETLRNQVNPHFLFNSFNTLISIIDTDKEDAIEYVQKLSDFFRDVVSNKDKNFISLRKELELAETYFYLQKKRFGKNLSLDIKIASQDWEKELPPMVLQLLIENAIKHNAVSSETPLYITIKSNDGNLEVINNKNEKRNKEPSTGTGLPNIINRYKLQTNKTVVVKESENNFSVTLPLI